MIDEIYVFRLSKNDFIRNLSTNEKIPDADKKGIKIEEWNPSLFMPYPLYVSSKYLLIWAWWVWHNKNIHYSSAILKCGDKKVSHLMITPYFPTWSFMERGDIQIKDVYTLKEYRGNRFAKYLLTAALKNKYNGAGSIWYLTRSSNFGSIALCKSLGFHFAGRYKKKYGIFSKGIIEK